MTLQFMEKGACGVVSVASHCVGRDIKEMILAFESGNKDRAYQIEARLMDIFKALFITSNPVPVKAAMEMLGFAVGQPRLPLVEATKDEKNRVLGALQALGLV